jgi:hypothetical protein
MTAGRSIQQEYPYDKTEILEKERGVLSDEPDCLAVRLDARAMRHGVVHHAGNAVRVMLTIAILCGFLPNFYLAVAGVGPTGSTE